ncbi:hypothetical protein OTU49_017000 [Cherax quadricarinatus]|uniref:Ig-like domain-containing protein n=1 Tax=Cherax quadricarinatus TaxID=27406 RepID=A0AAW0XTG7_CHEQU
MDAVDVPRILLFLLVLNIKNDVIVGLHITKVRVPTPLAVGEGGWLECEFVDEGESIYALKWYLGLDEFYRWTPAENPPVKTFPVKGDPLTVDIAASNRGKVKIHDVTLGASGVFRCEVSAEAPDFHTESDVATMTVVGRPELVDYLPAPGRPRDRSGDRDTRSALSSTAKTAAPRQHLHQVHSIHLQPLL